MKRFLSFLVLELRFSYLEKSIDLSRIGVELGAFKNNRVK
jgi:hypothetical protein